jgi:hypothetical protein
MFPPGDGFGRIVIVANDTVSFDTNQAPMFSRSSRDTDMLMMTENQYRVQRGGGVA